MGIEMEDSSFTKTKKLCYPHEFRPVARKEGSEACDILRFLLGFTPSKTVSHNILGKSSQ